MTRIKMCGLSGECDIKAANLLEPEYIGFVFAVKSSRFVSFEEAAALKKKLSPSILAVGVFVDEAVEQVAALLENGTIDLAQLHGSEDETYLRALRELTDKPVIKAFRVGEGFDPGEIEGSSADYVLLDSAAGSGETFDWSRLGEIKRPYFLAGGLDSVNVGEAVKRFHPFAVDVSSGIETGGRKDTDKMAAFAAAVRKEIWA